MRTALVLLAVISTTTPAFASSLQEEIKCHLADTKNAHALEVQISTVNRPDFEIGHYDSAKEEFDRANSAISRNGKRIDARLITYTSIDGKMKETIDRDSHGKPCVSGSVTSGIQVAAKIIVGHKAKLVILSCTDELIAPHGGECQ